MWTVFYFTPYPVPSCPAYEPNSKDCEYSHPFRHIQYNRIASLRPIATNRRIQAVEQFQQLLPAPTGPGSQRELL